MTDPRQTADALISQLTTALDAVADPAERARITGAVLTAVPALQSKLRQIRQGAVRELRAAGASHAEVAAVLGVSRPRAAQIAEGRTSRGRREPDA